ncbi:hypothetical protein NLI96_g5038 [Meripilus lineatus]|uniref:G domain-containing protein n=1 Tax=Meripilus lineatus TaxID=2056292 RepID=A0AAD5V3R2_9APHY|nr:hypothetical protein NLI96_g5038 [Physisporinus lineatus]
MDGIPVTMIDTPGFDDTTMSDTEILNKIASYLSVSYEFGYRLSGIIYMHRITDTRMTGSSLKNYFMFKNLCGERGMRNVGIITNMWGQIPQDIAEAREDQLRSEDLFFKEDIAHGALLMRHDGSLLSARGIIRHFLKLRPATLQVQHEIVVENRDVTETSACAVMDEGLGRLKEKIGEDIQGIKDEIEEALKGGDSRVTEELGNRVRGLEDNLLEIDVKRQEMSRAFTEERRRAKGLIKELIRRGSSADKGKGTARSMNGKANGNGWIPPESEWNEFKSRQREHTAEIAALKRQVHDSSVSSEKLGKSDSRRSSDVDESDNPIFYALICVIFIVFIARVASV